MEIYLLRKGISLDNIRSMSEEEVQEYFTILGVIDELEEERISK